MAQALLRGARPARALALALILTLGGALLAPAGRAAPAVAPDWRRGMRGIQYETIISAAGSGAELSASE